MITQIWCPCVALKLVPADVVEKARVISEYRRHAEIAERAFPGARVNYVGSGTFRVPAQVPPGTYIVAAGSSTFGCAWVRLKADDDKPKSVIDSGTVNRGGFDRFTVASGDRVLKLLGDCTWAAIDPKETR